MDFHGLQRALWSFADFRLIIAAGRCGLLRHLATSPATADDVAKTLSLHPLAVRKVMGALCALDILRHEDGRFRVVDELVPLFAEGDGDIAPFLEHLESMSAAWGAHLEGWLESGEWPSRERTPDQVALFGRAMRAIGNHTAQLVAGALDLRGVERILDLGGGLGHMSRVLCEAAGSACRATVVDRPEVAAKGAEVVRGTIWADRLRFVGGDYAEEQGGGGYDLVLVANVLHQEQALCAAAVVSNAVSAAKPNGRVAIVDFAVDDDRCVHRLGTLFAVNMKSFGDTWTEPEIRGWMSDAGLMGISRSDLGPDRWLFQGWRPAPSG